MCESGGGEGRLSECVPSLLPFPPATVLTLSFLLSTPPLFCSPCSLPSSPAFSPVPVVVLTLFSSSFSSSASVPRCRLPLSLAILSICPSSSASSSSLFPSSSLPVPSFLLPLLFSHNVLTQSHTAYAYPARPCSTSLRKMKHNAPVYAECDIQSSVAASLFPLHRHSVLKRRSRPFFKLYARSKHRLLTVHVCV